MLSNHNTEVGDLIGKLYAIPTVSWVNLTCSAKLGLSQQRKASGQIILEVLSVLEHKFIRSVGCSIPSLFVREDRWTGEAIQLASQQLQPYI